VPPVTGYFVLGELVGAAAERVREIQREFDPKLAASGTPHVTLAGSSGVGPIRVDTSVERIRDALAPIAAEWAPLELRMGAPVRFMQTSIVVLPLDPHGPLRALHERIATSGLPFARPRFTFSPHCTLSFYPTLTPAAARRLLALRVDEPAVIDALRVYRHRDPLPPVKVLDLPLGAVGASLSS
jgi:2'-5' RNA ligase